ncbi:fasciclin domain-containing protein [Spongiimicrobium salis]|uniref:fasciclin domain-containing protein n=1 Tax=Spongiimicrobium salis TaxID=1667022 RepID=UPI00374CDF31
MKKVIFISSMIAFLAFAQTVTAQGKKDIVDTAVSLDDFSTLVAAVKAADLVGALKGDGPFTVFAPTNNAFGKLPKGTVGSLLKPENKGTLTAVLTYHVVAGKFMAKDIVKAIKANGGSFMVKTLQGQELVASMKNGKVYLMDAKGGKSQVVITDVAASNGVIHAIESVVMPK